VLLAIGFVVGCSGKKHKDSEQSSAALSAPLLPPPESAEVIFKKNGKELGRLAIEDTDRGLSATFSSKKMPKGDYVLTLDESCKPPARAKSELPRRAVVLEIGQFSTVSGDTSSEFTLNGYSVADRFSVISEKSVSLRRKAKKGPATRVACGKIVKR